MKIEYLGHSCFLIISRSGLRIVCDPYNGIGYEMPKVQADIVTVSHHHYDHDYVAGVGGDPAVIDSPCDKTVGDVKISAVKSFHDDAGGRLRGSNLIFTFTSDGISVCHMGDLGEKFSRGLIEKLAPVDVLLIPVGGNYTIDAAEALKYTEAIAPRIVIPMHYSQGGNIDIDGVRKFMELSKDHEVSSRDGQLELTRADLRGEIKIIKLGRKKQ